MRAPKGQSEILKCTKCGGEFEFYYDDDNKVVAETKCKCNKSTKEKIDSALKVIDEQLKQQGK